MSTEQKKKLEQQLWKVDGSLGTQNNRLCRMYTQSTREDKRLQLYVGNGDDRRYYVFDDREDYLQFRCRRE